MTELSVIGKNVIRLDALAKVTGEAKYTSEVYFPGMLYGKILWSPYPHARIISIDTSRAEKLPGVKAVMTGKDVPDARLGRLADRHLLARDRVRFIGDAVAAVAASTADIAEEALGLISVKYEELPAVFDPEEAMKPECPAIIHPDLSSYKRLVYPYLGRDLPGPNVYVHHKARRGNVEDGFKKADLIVENRYSIPKSVHCQLEPYSSVAYVESDGTLVIWTSTHCIFSLAQREIASLFNLPLSKVRVMTSYIGGNFGASPRAERFAALLALKTRKPVQVAYSREETFIDGLNRLPKVIYIKDGVKSDGTLLAREMKLICRGGAYGGTSPLIIRNGSFGASMYRMPNFKWDAYGVYTNEPPCGSFRGFGNMQIFWAIEQQMDIIAEKLGIDPVDLRKKNLIKEGEENIRGEITHSIGAEECLDKVAEWIGWGEPSEAPVIGNLRQGKGLALANKYTMVDTVSAAVVKVHRDGTIEVRHGSDEVGQGVNTILSQIAAEEFGISVEKVKIVWGDTANVPFDVGALSSRTTFMTGNAVRLACQDAKRKLFEIAAHKMGVSLEEIASELETKDGKVFLRKSPEKAVEISDLFLYGAATGAQKTAPCPAEGGELLGTATFLIRDASEEDPETGQGTRHSASYCYTAQAAEVAVDMETGKVEILRFCSSNDMGKALNPKLCEGQMEGGMGMGIGSAVYEGMVMDKGRVLNPNFTDYKLPTAVEIPSGDNTKSIIVEAPHREGPFGAKGTGEAALTPTAPAIANAIYNATGVRIMDLPMTPERVLRSLKEAKAKRLLPD